MIAPCERDKQKPAMKMDGKKNCKSHRDNIKVELTSIKWNDIIKKIRNSSFHGIKPAFVKIEV